MKENVYNGRYISGKGDEKWLELLDKSFSMLHSSPVLPNLKMLYKSEYDMFSEGFIWSNGWWIQNSYGFTLGAVPLLDEFWSHILQNSYDEFWKRMGDGKRIGNDSGVADPDDLGSLCAPDGSLGDCVLDGNMIVYRQGDGDWKNFDWFYEATAAGANMEADMLLFNRDIDKIKKYIPLLWRSLNCVERTRDESGLFLVGTSADLLAPSYGGSFNEETGEIGKAYLTGLAVTYSAALKRFIELLRMVGDDDGVKECTQRLEKNLSVLPTLLTAEGYFCKSMDKDGTQHGVYGAEKYGYLSSIANVDAIAGDVVDRKTAESIYRKIAEVEGIRQAGVLCNNYPHLTDTYQSYRKRSTDVDSLGWHSGDWVDGGCWCTVEGRALLSYLKLGKYDDAFRAADWYMRWADEYRQDEPFSQWGHNTNNPWQKENDDYSICERPASIMIDNFAAVTCLLRGLFEYKAGADTLTVIPHIPESMTEYSQKVPIYFGGCMIYVSYRGGEAALRAKLTYKDDASAVTPDVSDGKIILSAEYLRPGSVVFLDIDCSGTDEEYAHEITSDCLTGDIEGVGDELSEIYNDCVKQLENETDILRRDMLTEIAIEIESAAARRKLPFDKHELRPMTEDKKRVIIGAYDSCAKALYIGLKHRS